MKEKCKVEMLMLICSWVEGFSCVKLKVAVIVYGFLRFFNVTLKCICLFALVASAISV